jgi:hypothetical protein
MNAMLADANRLYMLFDDRTPLEHARRGIEDRLGGARG